jgi:hypothetical protein
MLQAMAVNAKRDQVVKFIVPTFAARSHMVYLKVPRNAAVLATPTVSFEHSTPKFVIFFMTEP